LGFPTGWLSARIKHFFWRYCRGLKNKLPHQPRATKAFFLAPLPGRKKISARGVSHAQSFTLLFVLLYFIFSCIVLSKIQKNLVPL
jgi:hypothetical protein